MESEVSNQVEKWLVQKVTQVKRSETIKTWTQNKLKETKTVMDKKATLQNLQKLKRSDVKDRTTQ